MMGEMQQNKHIKQLFFVVMLGFVFLCLHTTNAFAQFPPAAAFPNCTQQIINPAASEATSVIPYGAPREPGRNHHGVDIMIPMCVPIQLQPNCRIILNEGSPPSPLWRQGGTTTGYGLFMRFKCGPRVEVRYAHLNGYNAASRMAINGKSGASRATPPHIHYEVLVYDNSGGNGIKVDPQCVWGAHPNQSDCCINVGAGCTLGINPADMCNDTILDQLRSNVLSSRAQGLNPTGATYTSTFNNGNIVTPAGIPLGQYPEDLPGCVDPTPPTDPGHVHIHNSTEGLETGPITTVGTLIIPGTEGSTVFPPITPPIPPTPGTPGGDPNLAPPPASGGATHNDGCATDTWTAMTNQAVMETRREDILNKRFIVKPDSVLDYSCFSNWYEDTATIAGPIFSETTRWDNLNVSLIPGTTTIRLGTLDQTTPPFDVEAGYQINPTADYSHSTGAAGSAYQLLGASSLDTAINMLVGGVATVYTNLNFNHPFLSGSTPVTGVSPTTCNTMANVWRAAKCKNFDGTDVFYTFTDLATLTPGNDPRAFPPTMQCF